MLATTQWPLERAVHLTSLVWVCVLWLPESLMDLSALWILCIIGSLGWGVHRSPVDSSQKGPLILKAFPCHNVIVYVTDYIVSGGEWQRNRPSLVPVPAAAGADHLWCRVLLLRPCGLQALHARIRFQFPIDADHPSHWRHLLLFMCIRGMDSNCCTWHTCEFNWFMCAFFVNP